MSYLAKRMEYAAKAGLISPWGDEAYPRYFYGKYMAGAILRWVLEDGFEFIVSVLNNNDSDMIGNVWRIVMTFTPLNVKRLIIAILMRS